MPSYFRKQLRHHSVFASLPLTLIQHFNLKTRYYLIFLLPQNGFWLNVLITEQIRFFNELEFLSLDTN